MIKTYVIDTNVLIQSPYALECFEDNNLVLPLVVLEELDGLKRADMMDSPLCWQITLSADECERSELAMDAIHRL